jgi:hypothetical protein
MYSDCAHIWGSFFEQGYNPPPHGGAATPCTVPENPATWSEIAGVIRKESP